VPDQGAGVRPSPPDLLARLERVASAPASEGLAKLHEANRTQVNRLSTAARRASEAASEDERRAELVRAGKEGIKDITEQLIATVLAAAPIATQEQPRDGSRSLTLGPAELRMFGVRDSSASLVGPGSGLPFDVVAYTAIGVAMPADHYGYEGRSHSLWFCDAQEAGGYAWFETAFTISAFAAQQTNRDPFALTPGSESAEALRPMMGLHQVAWPFKRLGAESLDEFIGRWAGWLAEASEQKLHRPTTMPEGSPQGSWRGSG
jgi:serine/threonine-protein kinase